MYQAQDRAQGEKILGRILIGCQSSDDAEMVRWGRTLKRWKVYLLNYFEHRTTNTYTEGVHTKMKLLKKASYRLGNIEVMSKMLLGFLPPLSHGCARSVPEHGQNIHFPLSKKK
jgi:transposase